MPDSIQHIAWSISGDRIGTACKVHPVHCNNLFSLLLLDNTNVQDKRARFFDPRAPAAIGEFSPHQGTKQAKFVWLNNSKCSPI
jgi:hypothetical protein